MDRKTALTQVIYDLGQINFVRIILIVAAAWLLIAAIERLFPKLADRVPGRLRMYFMPLAPILRLLIMVVAIILIVPLVIKPSFQNLVAILGATGLALGFALKDYASSVFAGIVAIYERPYRPGDWVEIEGAYGEVQSLSLRALRMVTPDDTVVTIPHLKIWDHRIYNSNDGKRSLLCVADFYLHPNHEAGLVRQKLYDVALASPYLDLEQPITVIVAEKPWGTHYRLKAYPIDGRDQFQFTSDLTVRGKAALAKRGITCAVVPVGYPLK
ncbi:MAG: mechanosensitive ion channel [Desulfobacca sp.]|nr:mechanosensitive ion channel [Desulfobacca sp.]